MTRGFGRRYWIQLIMQDGSEDWITWNDSYDSAVAAAGIKLMSNPQIEYGLLLDGRVKEGEVATKKQILASFDKKHKPGARKLRIPV